MQLPIEQRYRCHTRIQFVGTQQRIALLVGHKEVAQRKRTKQMQIDTPDLHRRLQCLRQRSRNFLHNSILYPIDFQ